MTTKDESLKLALEAMNLARAAHGQMLLSDPPQEAWKAWGVSAALTKAMTAASEALAEQPAQPCGYPYCGCNSKAWCKLERMAENARELGLDYGSAQQQSGIKQVIELYDSPEQPAQQKPVAWQWLTTAHFRKRLPKNAEKGAWNPLYTSPPASKPCEWQREDDIHMPGTWRSDCGVLWTFTEGGPVENDMKHCCGCGAKLREKNA